MCTHGRMELQMNSGAARGHAEYIAGPWGGDMYLLPVDVLAHAAPADPVTSVAALQPMLRIGHVLVAALASARRRPILCAGLPTPVGGRRRLVTRGDDKLLADGLDELDVLGRGCFGRVCQGRGELRNRIFNLLDRGLLGRLLRCRLHSLKFYTLHY